MTERTLLVIKPDGVRRGLVGRIIMRFEERGFTLRKLRVFRFSKAQAEEFYSPHKGKSFFAELVEFVTSGPVVAILVEGRNAVATARQMIGATRSYEAASGSIRGDFSLGVTDNIIHAADSPESVHRESKIIFRAAG